METNLEQRMKKYAKQHKRKKIWQKVLSVLSAVVVFCTTYALILPAITQEREAFCGFEEHSHSEGCYSEKKGEEVLIKKCRDESHLHSADCFAIAFAGQNPVISASCEIEPSNPHSHSEECYANNLICITEENHFHTEECYTEGNLSCEKPEGHIHSEECFEKSLVCTVEETEGHNHDIGCFEVKFFACEKEEHKHTLICYSDETADIETKEQWKQSFGAAKIGEVVSENLIEIAKTQLGYHESTKNYLVAEDGETIIGRSRYGEWYGKPYAEWNSLFVGFCLEYAGSEIPFDADIEKWIEVLSLPENDVYIEAEKHSPLPGDLVFIKSKGAEKADTVGIICEVYETGIKVIIGDQGDCVQYAEYAFGEDIVGYGKIAVPSPYKCGREEHIHSEKCFDELGNIFCGYDEHIHSEKCLEEPSGEPEDITEEETENPEETKEEYSCGFEEHSHGEGCFDESGNLVCEIVEHSHTEECKISFENLTEEEKFRIEYVISMIEELPTADEIDSKIEEFEEAEDYEGEEAWLTEIYSKVCLAYKYYSNIPDNQKQFVTNSEKLMELEFIWSAAVLIETEIADTIEYSANMFTDTALFVVYTQGTNGYYAFDGTGNAVPINISADGTITANVNDRNELLWSFTKENTDTYIIKNMSSGRYMHAYPNNGSGVTTSGAYSSVIVTANGGVRIRSNTEYAYLDESSGTFKMTQTQSRAAVYNFGIYDTSDETYIWIDGTNGGMGYLSGSDNTGYTVKKGESFVLPESWKTPDGYNYIVRGWYDIVNEKYHLPGEEIIPERSTVFYADWIPATYDIGQFNAMVSGTVSTNDFITTKVFDYNPFFNFPYVTANITVNASGHNETWSIDSTAKGAGNLIFRDWDGGKLSYPNGSNAGDNQYTGDNTNANLFTDEVRELIFGTGNIYDPATGTGVLGKTYLGTGDHLFQYCDDPANTEHYGYYYYDSLYHAASYNRGAQRFFVYDYLERATTSSTADFLPLNSPYVNTNGKPVGTYTNSGQYGEYDGTTHYQYTGGSGVVSEYWFGIQTDIEFFLPSDPGGKDSEGNNVNQGINGKDLVFEFTGDDDVWVFVDGILVLDIGGIHNALEGSINFATGVVTVNGNTSALPSSIGAGDHVLTMYYLERGSSASNCRIKFNITTRYGLKLQKEDVLTRELLNGAEFSVFTDEACTVPAQLWDSEISHKNGDEAKNVFKVSNGYTYMWGLAAGNTYYIKETKYPDNGYGAANGIIVMKINNLGTATFEVIPDPDADENVSGGFTVHGYKIDVENHEVYLVATNGNYGDEVTSIQAVKKWNDSIDHSGDSVTVYLIANEKRIREVVLNEANGWKYVWENLPMYNSDGTEVSYDIVEGTVPGYYGTVTTLETTEIETITWEEKSSFENGGTYILKNTNGYLAANSGGLYWETDENNAKASEYARWVVSKSGSTHTFTNEAGYTIYYSNQYFRAAKNVSSGTGLSFSNKRILYGSRNYMGSISGGSARRTTSSSSALTFTPYMETVTTEVIEVEGKGFLITNTPVDEMETVSIKVNKKWDTGNFATEESYEQLTITVKLLANGAESGMTATISIKNGWTCSFNDLPKVDNKGNDIVYTVEEVLPNGDWSASYGGITATGENSFETTITNTYNLHYELPKTGGSGYLINIMGGTLLFGAAFALIYRQTSYQKRRKEEDSS